MIRIALSFAAFVLFSSSFVHAQEATTDTVRSLFGGSITSGGFGGPVMKVGSVLGETAVFFGGRGAWVINRTWALGGGGYVMMTPRTLAVSSVPDAPDTLISVGYGGVEIEYLVASNEIVHASVMALVGAGSVTTRLDQGRHMGMFGDGRNEHRLTNDVFFVIEPQINAELNLTSWFRVGLGMGYRYVNGLQTQLVTTTVNNTDIDGLNGVLTLKFGRY